MKKNKYLCREFDETFIIEANTFKEANESAMEYGGCACRKLTKEEATPIPQEHGGVAYNIHEDVESYMRGYDSLPDDWKNVIKNDILDIVDKHFEKIER